MYSSVKAKTQNQNCFSLSMDVTEKLCLQWNDFKENATSSFRELREDKDLTDVNLVFEEGSQVETHKIILQVRSSWRS